MQNIVDGAPKKSLSLRTKINLAIALIFVLVIASVTFYSSQRQQEATLLLAEQQVKDMSTMYFDSLNTMMLTGTMSERGILRKKMLRRNHVLEARVVRGMPVKGQFGEGMPEEQAVDELDQRALAGEDVLVVKRGKEGRVVTVLTPFRATTNTRGVNCLQCHQVPSGAVNGAIRISYSLADLDAAVQKELWIGAGANVLLLGLGLVLVNLLLRNWISVPLRSVMDAVSRRAQGDRQARSNVMSYDELGQLARAFNKMADKVDESADRERHNAEELCRNVNELLSVVSRAAAGDLSVEVNVVGGGAIGELGRGLQQMIEGLRGLMEERRQAIEDLQAKVDGMLAMVTRAAGGDLTGTLPDLGEDAIGRLGKSMQCMVDKLSGLVNQVQQSGIQVTSSATEIAATAKQQEATAAEQAATVNEIVATSTEISATAKELLNTMEEVAHVSEATAEAAANGQSGLEKMEATMHHVVDASASIASKLEVLNEKASNINTVVTTITKVADQTNLLSLNAAIEAEKAGEYGQGFAVVATEIRRLADQTAVATWDIEQMVKEMQSAVTAGVMSVEKFSEEVRRSVAEVETVGHQLVQIIEQVQALTPRFETVHEGMQSQAQGAEQIKQAMIQLNEAAQQTVQSLRQSNSAIERLNDAAHGLQQGVSRFKVKKRDSDGGSWLASA
ncbi:MAG TPA: HAMP domain-containing protein [Gammaproteobacteria bacterium]|nr:HAMP domain-containing protein [Gammaproteobacteria bacterium]